MSPLNKLLADTINLTAPSLAVWHGEANDDILQLAQSCDMDIWARVAGSNVVPATWHKGGPYKQILLPLPKGRDVLAFCLACLAPQLTFDGILYLFGSNDEGIKSANKILADFFANVDVAAIGGKGRIYAARQPTVKVHKLADMARMAQLNIAGQDIGFTTYPGLFAKSRLDEASALLIDHLPLIAPGARVLDYACGLGVLARAAQLLQSDIQLTLADYDALAVEAAHRNVPQANLYCVAAPEEIGGTFDLVLSNPPIHNGQVLDHGIVQRIIGQLDKWLTPLGAAYIVAQVTVPVATMAVERKLAATEVAASRSFRVTRVSR